MADAPESAAKASWQAAAGPTVDLSSLVRQHHANVYRYAARLCGCPTEAEDLTQQTFLIAHEKLHQLREPERATAWLLAILRRAFLKSLRRPRPTALADVDLLTNDARDGDAPMDAIDKEELTAALDELPDDFRLVLLMFYFEDLSYQEMAEQLEIPIGTVMSRLSRAKAHLQRRLASEERQPLAPPHGPPARRVTRKESLQAPS